MPIFEHVSPDLATDVVGWLCVVAGLAAYILVPAIADGRRPARLAVASVVQAEPHAPRSDWEQMADELGVRPASIETMLETHTRASRQIAALEYACNRLRTDYGHLLSEPVTQHGSVEQTPSVLIRPTGESLAA